MSIVILRSHLPIVQFPFLSLQYCLKAVNPVYLLQFVNGVDTLPFDLFFLYNPLPLVDIFSINDYFPLSVVSKENTGHILLLTFIFVVKAHCTM